LGASESNFDSGNKTSNKGKVTINFVEFGKRHGKLTNPYLSLVREAVKDIPGAEITVDKMKNGPPTGKPINIEVTGDNLEEMITTTARLKHYIDSLRIPGIEELKTDFDNRKPEILVAIDRVRANREGISTAQIGSELHTAIFGTESSKFREGEDQYPIQIRYKEEQRNNIDQLMDTKITYRDMNSGTFRQIPMSAVASIEYTNSYGGINRKNAKRIINITSNVLTGYNANEIIGSIRKALPSFQKSEEVDLKITGEQEDQQETSAFMGKAMMLAIFLILFILITQFNSLGKPVIILLEVLLSLIGVFIGYGITHMPFSIIMCGMGIVALAGIVVRNGILLVEFTDILRNRGQKTRDAIIQAGKTRITPVMLTASACILGLIPLAIGFNIDFVGLLESFSPKIHFGGDNVMFFGPLSWTIIFGLSVATVLTLLFIPAMYYVMYTSKLKIRRTVTALTVKRKDLKDLV
jgi:multidrug efflux pump subunit AcrB